MDPSEKYISGNYYNIGILFSFSVKLNPCYINGVVNLRIPREDTACIASLWVRMGLTKCISKQNGASKLISELFEENIHCLCYW